MIHDVQKEYLDWIRSLIFSGKHRWVGPYDQLIGWLMDRDFEYTIPMDANRFADGEELRYRFGQERGYAMALISSELDDRPCSMLEMMTALALRCEEDIMQDPYEGVNPGRWFWIMVQSLGLHRFTDGMFDPYKAENTIQRFFNKELGLFPLKEVSVMDLRKAEIWAQAMWYMTEWLRERRNK